MSAKATKILVAMVLGALTALPAQAQSFLVTFENLQPTNGFSFTPVWIASHDGTFDVFNGGAAASPELEALAELGDVGPLRGLFAGSGAGIDRALPGNGFGAGSPPIFTPGDSATISLNDGGDYFSFASMIIPSNDAFIGNSDPMTYNIGNLNVGDSLTIDITRFYDAGTEVNDPTDGAAFSTDGTTPPNGQGGTDENGNVTLGDFANFNATFLNTNTPNGQVTAGLQNVLGRITITAVPEPGSLGFLGALGVVLGTFRRRRRS